MLTTFPNLTVNLNGFRSGTNRVSQQEGGNVVVKDIQANESQIIQVAGEQLRSRSLRAPLSFCAGLLTSNFSEGGCFITASLCVLVDKR